MADQRARIRLNFTTAEIEVDGPVDLVKEFLDEYRPMVQGGAAPKGVAPAAPRITSASTAQSSPRNTAAMPESFGEYLHAFPDNLSGPDKTLVAAAYIQSTSEDKSFSTGEVNAILKDHGIRLANASVAVKRIVAAKHAFPTARGRFRVSTEGDQAVNQMKRGEQNG